MEDQIQRDSNKVLRITCSKKVWSEYFEQDNDVKFVDSQIRRLKDGTCQSLLLWSTRSS